MQSCPFTTLGNESAPLQLLQQTMTSWETFTPQISDAHQKHMTTSSLSTDVGDRMDPSWFSDDFTVGGIQIFNDLWEADHPSQETSATLSLCATVEPPGPNCLRSLYSTPQTVHLPVRSAQPQSRSSVSLRPASPLVQRNSLPPRCGMYQRPMQCAEVGGNTLASHREMCVRVSLNDALPINGGDRTSLSGLNGIIAEENSLAPARKYSHMPLLPMVMENSISVQPSADTAPPDAQRGRETLFAPPLFPEEPFSVRRDNSLVGRQLSMATPRPSMVTSRPTIYVCNSSGFRVSLESTCFVPSDSVKATDMSPVFLRSSLSTA